MTKYIIVSTPTKHKQTAIALQNSVLIIYSLSPKPPLLNMKHILAILGITSWIRDVILKEIKPKKNMYTN